VAFNPTPDRPAELRPHRGDAPPATGNDDIDSLLDQLPVSGQDQFFRPPPGEPVTPPGPADVPAIGLSAEAGYPSLASMGILAFLAAVAGAVYMGWQRSVQGLPYPQQLWEKTVRMASWAGEPPRPGQTPHEYAKRLGKRFRDVWDWDGLADAYTRSRFGKREPDEEEAERLRDAWPDMRGALVGGVLGRPFKRNKT
jgi:hypothetical protein